PGGGSNQGTPSASQANWADANSGILPLAAPCSCAGTEVNAVRTAMLARTAIEAQRSSVLHRVQRSLESRAVFGIGRSYRGDDQRRTCATLADHQHVRNPGPSDSKDPCRRSSPVHALARTAGGHVDAHASQAQSL